MAFLAGKAADVRGDANTPLLRICRIDANGTFVLGSAAAAVSAGKEYYLRFVVLPDGTDNLRAKVWAVGEEEPWDWPLLQDSALNATDSALDASAGEGKDAPAFPTPGDMNAARRRLIERLKKARGVPPTGPLTEKFLDARLHFTGSFIGKRHCKNVPEAVGVLQYNFQVFPYKCVSLA